MTYTSALIQQESSQGGIERRLEYEKLTSEWKEEREAEIKAVMKFIEDFSK